MHQQSKDGVAPGRVSICVNGNSCKTLLVVHTSLPPWWLVAGIFLMCQWHTIVRTASLGDSDRGPWPAQPTSQGPALRNSLGWPPEEVSLTAIRLYCSQLQELRTLTSLHII